MITYFVDESGNSGDLARPGDAFGFDGQEVFVLAGVGVAHAEALPEVLRDLKRSHRIQADELKFASVRKKPRFLLELIDALAGLDATLLSEVVDKRYFIAAHMVSALILPPIPGASSSPEEHFVRNAFADYLVEAPLEVFRRFVGACQSPSGEAISGTFRAVLAWLDERHRGEIADALRHATSLGFAEFRDDDPEQPETVARWLPSPDPSLSGSPLWILPNLSSFTNLYARINRAHDGELGLVRLVHDEQRYYAHVLADNKAAAEGLPGQGLDMPFEHADWSFTSSAELTFADSREEAGLQAADVLAGFLMTYVRNRLYRTTAMDREWRMALDRLLDGSDHRRGLGVNLVASNRAFRKLGIAPKLDPWISSAFGARR